MLPYREIDQSGVLFTALAFGKPMLATRRRRLPGDRGTGAAELVAAGRRRRARRARLTSLLADPARLARMAAASRAAAEGPYSWDAIARRTLELYAALQA